MAPSRSYIAQDTSWTATRCGGAALRRVPSSGIGRWCRSGSHGLVSVVSIVVKVEPAGVVVVVVFVIDVAVKAIRDGRILFVDIRIARLCFGAVTIVVLGVRIVVLAVKAGRIDRRIRGAAAAVISATPMKGGCRAVLRRIHPEEGDERIGGALGGAPGSRIGHAGHDRRQ
jgi:hypothetical protein